MRLTQAGIPCAVALLGTTLSDVQSAWLGAADSVLPLLDGDQAGRKAARVISRRLASVTVHNLPQGHEPEDLSDHELVELVVSVSDLLQAQGFTGEKVHVAEAVQPFVDCVYVSVSQAEPLPLPRAVEEIRKTLQAAGFQLSASRAGFEVGRAAAGRPLRCSPQAK